MRAFAAGEPDRSGLSLLFLAVFFTTILALPACQHRSEYFGKVDPPAGNVFRFNNGAEPEYIDPALMVGQPDARIAEMLFEGLTVTDSETHQPTPGAAERWEISSDRTVYTFYLRKNGMWSDGRPATAQDFVYSWTRVLDPKTASRYATLLYCIANGEAFNRGSLKDASQLGLRALDDYTLEVRLRQPVPFFLFLTGHFPYFPVPAHLIAQYGRRWTEPAHIAGNGPFLLVEHRMNAKFEFVRNPQYWNAGTVRLDRVTAYSVDDNHTSANMYESGMLDWLPSGFFPAEYVPYMRGRFQDLHAWPFLGIYYYGFNVTRPPLNNPLVRRALSVAVDRRAITDELLRGGQIPSAHFVPVGFSEYQSPAGPEYNPAEAARLLAQAGYPNGQGLPALSILFNSSESHKQIAESVQQMWARNLNIHVTIRNEEWASYLKSLASLDYDIARQGWVADYPDPTSFADLMESTNGNNHTGWKNPGYDRFLSLARGERDPMRRMGLLQKGEVILLDDLPVMPIYTYSSNELIKPYVRGLFPSPTDQHLLNHVWVDHEWGKGIGERE